MGVSMKLLPPEGQSYIVAGALLSIVLNPVIFALTGRMRRPGGLRICVFSAGVLGGSGRGIRQSDRLLANQIGGNQPERRSGAGKERLAAAEHDGMEVESVFIDEAKAGQASGQLGSGNRDLANEPGLKAA